MLTEKLKVKIFADGADRASMIEMNQNAMIQGLTTNPTLMRKVGIKDYEAFARDILEQVTAKPISLEVFSDEFDEMERQAVKIASWGPNVFAKIPVSNTRREMSYSLIRKLADRGVQLNITAIMTLPQVARVIAELEPEIPSYVSVFAGRIADTGIDPLPTMRGALALCDMNPRAELIWASPRELLNLVQADEIGCHVITMTSDLLKKISLIGYDLDQYSLDTVKMFRDDAVQAGFVL